MELQCNTQPTEVTIFSRVPPFLVRIVDVVYMFGVLHLHLYIYVGYLTHVIIRPPKHFFVVSMMQVDCNNKSVGRYIVVTIYNPLLSTVRKEKINVVSFVNVVVSSGSTVTFQTVEGQLTLKSNFISTRNIPTLLCALFQSSVLKTCFMECRQVDCFCDEVIMAHKGGLQHWLELLRTSEVNND